MTATVRDVRRQRMSRLVRPSVVLVVSVLLGTSLFAAEATPTRVGAKMKLQLKQKSIPVPKVFVTPPGPNTMVLVDVPRNRKIPFVQWLRLFGNAYDAETKCPMKTAPYDGQSGEGAASAETGALSVSASDQGAGVYQVAGVYWDFTFDGGEDIDVQYTAKLAPIWSATGAAPGGSLAGGGFAQVMISLIARDNTAGEELKQIIYRESCGNAGGFPTFSSAATEPGLPLRLKPGHAYRFSVQLYASACGYCDPGPKGSTQRGHADAEGSTVVEAMSLVPTHGPKVEVKVRDVYPEAQDTWDHYEKALVRFRKKAYFPTQARVHFFCGGQYDATDSRIRIGLTRGSGTVSLLQPGLVAAANWRHRQVSDSEIELIPPPPVPGGMGGHTIDTVVQLNMEAYPWIKTLHHPVDYALGPVLRVWGKLDMRIPDRPTLIVPTSRLTKIYSAANWFVMMPADGAVTAFNASNLKLATPIPVLYASPAADTRAPAPAPVVPGWQVKTVPWAQVASPTLKAYNKPVVAVNLAAIADLYVLDPNARNTMPVKVVTPKLTLKEPTPFVLPQRPEDLQLAIAFKRLNLGYFQGTPDDRQSLLNAINNTIGQWMKDLAVKAEDRPELMLWVDDDGKVTTGKSLLEEIQKEGALNAMVECYDQLKSIEDKARQIALVWPHLDFYCEKGSLTIRGKAANGKYFESTDTDSDDFHTFFNFVPRPEAETVVLVPYMP